MPKPGCHLRITHGLLSKPPCVSIFFSLLFFYFFLISISVASPSKASKLISSSSPCSAFTLRGLGSSFNDALLGLLQGSYRINLDEDGKNGLIVHYDFHNIDYGLKGIGLTRRRYKKHKNWSGVIEKSKIKKLRKYFSLPFSRFKEGTMNPNQLLQKNSNSNFEGMENTYENRKGGTMQKRLFTMSKVESELHLKQTHAESWKLVLERPYLLYRFLLCSYRLSNAEYGTMIGMEYNGHNESLRGLFSKTFRLDNRRLKSQGIDSSKVKDNIEKPMRRKLLQKEEYMDHSRDEPKSIQQERQRKSPIDLKISLTPIFTWKRLNLSGSVPKKSKISPSFDIFSGATTCEWIEALPFGIIGRSSKSLRSSSYLLNEQAKNKDQFEKQYGKKDSEGIIEEEEEKDNDPLWAIRESIKAKYGKSNIDRSHAQLEMMKKKAKMLGTGLNDKKITEGVAEGELKAFDSRIEGANIMNSRRRGALRISLFTSPFYGTSNTSGCFLKLEYSQLGAIPIAPPESMCTKLSVSIPIFTSLFTSFGTYDDSIEAQQRNDKRKDRTVFAIEHFFHVNMNSIWPHKTRFKVY